MIWKRIDDTCIESSDGRWRITRFGITESFVVYRKAGKDVWSALTGEHGLRIFKDAQEARDACR